ncbi:MAG: GNAT family N-acetyltransferase [Bacteriovoracaceae bacterium]|nr:GNAT family N-acetyltransferase [Bacteriovoracaceae bacterium]
MELNFKTAQISDLKKLSHFVNRAYRGESAKLGWTHEADLLDGTRVDESLLCEEFDRGVTYLLATIDQQLVGCFHFEMKTPELAYVGMITVSPELQGKGIGKKLLEQAFRRAKNLKANTIALTVMSDRLELIAYYERQGFKLTGLGEDFNPNDSRYGLPKKALRLLEMKRALN